MILSFRAFAPWLILFAVLPTVGGAGLGRPDKDVAPPAPQSYDARGPIAGPFQAEVLRTVDGDTFEARVRVWFGQDVRSLIRIRGFDAPERAAACEQEARAADEATQTLNDILASGRVTLNAVAPDKYFGRVVADVSVRLTDGVETDVAALMLASGQGRPYAGRRREGWCDQRMARTGVPTETRANRSMTSSSSIRMQP